MCNFMYMCNVNLEEKNKKNCTILYNLRNTNLQAMLKLVVPCSFQIKPWLNQHKKPITGLIISDLG